jgi:beta-alanine--pyruvate transaminase
VDHLRHTHDLQRNAFSVGLPAHGAELADDLERLVQLHGAETIAAVIVEPMAGSTGVLVPPAEYLPRLAEIARRHGILLIFDEVITGFGRLGTAFAAEYFGVIPDIMTTAKGLTNGAIPMGAVFVKRAVHDAVVQGPDNAIELFHGYTYSGHPAACAAGLATLDIYEREGLLTRAASLETYWRDLMLSFRGARNVIDVRAIGLVAGIELASREGRAGERAYEAFISCLRSGLLTRVTGDVIALSPPLIAEKEHLDSIFSIVSDAIDKIC